MSGKAKHDVFISYRREGGSALAQLVYKHLQRKGYRVLWTCAIFGRGNLINR